MRKNLTKQIIEVSDNNDYTTGNLLDFCYFKKTLKLIAVDLSKKTKLKGPQQINFFGQRKNQTNGATMFFIIEKSEETTFKSSQNCHNHINNGNTKYCKFVKRFWQWKLKIRDKKWYVIDSKSRGNYSEKNQIKFLTKSLESSLCDYSDAYISVTGNMTVTGGDANTKVAFKNCAPFRECRTEINETFVDNAEHINIAMPMYNLIEYSDNYSDTSGSLWQFKRDEIEGDVDLTVNAQHIPNNSSSFKYKSSFITNRNGVKIAVPLKYLSNFWRSLEMPLINCKVELSLIWNENCVIQFLQ